jgi:hypothetical protein
VPVLISILLALASLQEPDTNSRVEIDVAGGIESLGASPNGDLWVLSRDGRAYVSRDRGVGWTEIALPLDPRTSHFAKGDEPKRIDFFDDRHGLITGRIGEYPETILRTHDGGRSWTAWALRHRMAVVDTSLDADGNLWLATDSGELFVTRDQAITFEKTQAPFEDEVSTPIFFASALRGAAVRAKTGTIRLTEDGAQSWNEVGAFTDAIVAIALLSDRVVIQKRWDLSHPVRMLRSHGRDPWEPLAIEGHAVAGVAGVAGSLLGVLSDRRVVRFTNSLAVDEIEPVRLPTLPYRLEARGSICMLRLDGRGQLGIIDADGVRSLRMFSSAPEAPTLFEFDLTRPASDSEFHTRRSTALGTAARRGCSVPTRRSSSELCSRSPMAVERSCGATNERASGTTLPASFARSPRSLV